MARENREDKGRRLLTEGRVILRWVVAEPNEEQLPIVADIRGDSGEVYRVVFDRGPFDWVCPCEARGLCSHIIALQLVTELPKPGQGGEFPA